MIILLIVGLTKKTLYKMSQYFPRPYEPFSGDINVTVDFFFFSFHLFYSHKKNITRSTSITT